MNRYLIIHYVARRETLFSHSCSVYWQIEQLRRGLLKVNSLNSRQYRQHTIDGRLTVSLSFYLLLLYLPVWWQKCIWKCVCMCSCLCLQLYRGSVQRWMSMLLTESGNSQRVLMDTNDILKIPHWALCVTMLEDHNWNQHTF